MRAYRWLFLLAGLIAVAVGALKVWYFNHVTIAVLQPRGPIAAQERELMIIAVVLGLFVVIPVFAMTFAIAWRYREGNSHTKYAPTWDHSKRLETIWWLIPTLIIGALAVIVWRSSHALDPFRPISSTTTPLTIQAVALDWKWLFIYPQQGIATVGYLAIPTGTPINFQITSDGPMNSLWIPQLGGQMYAMPGMSTQLHLMADQAGNYTGTSANISGRGFAGMRFIANAVSPDDFSLWVQSSKRGATSVLDQPTYDTLAQPSENQPVGTYTAVAPGLYDHIMMKYMAPMSDMSMPGMDMGAMR